MSGQLSVGIYSLFTDMLTQKYPKYKLSSPGVKLIVSIGPTLSLHDPYEMQRAWLQS
jgi:hypothetical protein